MQRKKIASKFNVWIIVSVCLVVTILTGLITGYLLHRFSKDINEKDALHVKGLASAVKGRLDNAFTLNYQLAINPEVIRTVANADPDWAQRLKLYNNNKRISKNFTPDGGMPLLVKMQQEYGFVELLFVQDIHGDQVARSFGQLGHRGHRWWYKKLFGDKDRKPFFTGSYYSMTGDKPVASAFHAIHDRGRFIGIIGTDINFEDLQNLVQSYLASDDLSAVVIDNQGFIIAHPDRSKLRELYNLKKMTRNILVKSETGASIQDMTGRHQTVAVVLDWDREVAAIAAKAIAGESGFADRIVLEGVECTLHYHPIQLPGAGESSDNYAAILIRSDASIARTKLQICLIAAMFGLLFIVVLIPLFHLRVRQIILNPLEILAASMRDMGTHNHKPIALATNDEFQLLAETYNGMCSKLAETNQELVTLNKELEERIAARTEDLKIANEKLQQDIITRKRIEAALRDSEELYRKTFETAPDAITITELESGTFLEVNEAFSRLSRFSRDETIGKTPFDLNLFADQTARGQFVALLKEHGEIFGVEVEYRRKDGRIFDTLLSAKLLRYRDKDCLISVVTDITRRKRAEAALKESEQNYRLLTENTREAIIVVQDGKFKFPNPQAKALNRLLGRSENDALDFSVIHPDDRKMVQERYLKRQQGEAVPNFCIFRLQGKENQKLWMELNDVNVTWNGRPAILGFLRDITDLRRLEEQVQTKLRMDAIGTLAGGIAHNFNNLLMGIQGNVSLMKLHAESVALHKEELESIEQCIDSGSDLSRQLLGFARGGKYAVKPLDPNEIVADTCRIFQGSSKKILVKQAFQDNVWTIEADRGQLELVLMNMYVNAGQAMERGGDLRITTENVTITPEDGEERHVTPGRYVKISIADTGIGMDDTTRKKIFEPFFTTKPIGQGSGLGMASAFGIIKNHSGFITVDSKSGAGSRFDIFLPASEKNLKQKKDNREELIAGSGTILLVDDEEMIVDVCRSMLEELGYTVIAALGGKQAIDLFEKNADQIDLVILDMIMPDINGEVVGQRLNEIYPDVKILFVTGHATELDDTPPVIGDDNFILNKPFDIRNLSYVLKAMLSDV